MGASCGYPALPSLMGGDAAEDVPGVDAAVDGPPQFTSCMGLATTCGFGANASCCGTAMVPGGTFNRSDDSGHPATVSTFVLDTYEVTVGRFRRS